MKQYFEEKKEWNEKGIINKIKIFLNKKTKKQIVRWGERMYRKRNNKYDKKYSKKRKENKRESKKGKKGKKKWKKWEKRDSDRRRHQRQK